MTVALYKWTVERYHQAIASGIFNDQPIELLRGDLVLMVPQGEPHAYYNTEAADYLRQILGNCATVRDSKPVTLPHDSGIDSEPEPDIAIVKPLGREYLDHHPYPDDIFLIIEFADKTLKKDLGQKQTIYAEAGIQEYWVVDLKTLTLNIFKNLANDAYSTQLTMTSGTITPVAFPSISVDVHRLMYP